MLNNRQNNRYSLTRRIMSLTIALTMVFTMVFLVLPYDFQSYAAMPSAAEVCGDSGSWGSWSTTVPAAGSYYETKTEYRYRNKETTTSYSTSLSGYIQDGGTWVESENGSILYVDSWPSGFNPSSWYYTQYSSNIPKYNSETTTRKTVVSTSVEYYIYWHWCDASGGQGISDHQTSVYKTWHSFNSKDIGRTEPLPYNSSSGGFYSTVPCEKYYWWYATYANNSTQLPLKRCDYTTYKRLFNYYKWLEWSDWSDTQYTPTSDRQVESRKLYRVYNYKHHAWDAGKVTRPARYTTTGLKTYTCQNCGTTISSTIPKLNASGVTPAKVVLKTAKVKSRKLTIKWKRVSKNVKGYQICLKNKKTGVKKFYNVKQSKKAILSKTIKKLAKKNTYAVRLRAYNVVNGETIYGPWSNVKSGKVK